MRSMKSIGAPQRHETVTDSNGFKTGLNYNFFASDSILTVNMTSSTINDALPTLGAQTLAKFIILRIR